MLNSLVATQSNPLLLYLLLFLGAVIEGPITLLAAGAGSAIGLLVPLPAFLCVVAGNLMADMSWYGLGRFGKLEWIKRYGPRIGVHPEQVSRLESGIQRYAPRLLFLSKLTIGLPIPTLLAIGLARIPIRRWIALLVAGEVLKSAILVAAGFFSARVIDQVFNDIQAVLWAGTGAVLVALAVWIFRPRSRRQAKATKTVPQQTLIHRKGV